MSTLQDHAKEGQLDFSLTAEFEGNDERKRETGNKNERPRNFLAKIASGCQQMTIHSVKQTEHKLKRHPGPSDKFNDGTEEFTTDIGGNIERDNTDPSCWIASICSSADSHDPATKMQLLSLLASACLQRPELYKTIGSSSLVYYAEGLLFTYVDAHYMHPNRRQEVIIPGPPISELTLLIPILELLFLAANMTVHQIRAIFLQKSRILQQLMRASTQCSYSCISTFNKLRAAVSDKLLAGSVLEMSCSDTLALFAKCFGIDASSLNLKLLGYHAILYDISGIKDMNINLDIIQKRSPSGKKYTQSLLSNSDPNSNKDCCENTDTVNWSDITVARVLLLKVALVYMKHDWKECLTYISSQVHNHLGMEDAPLLQPKIGDVYGFWNWDAIFEGQPLLMVQCFRGQVLTLTGDWAMFWAIDVGLLGYIPKDKIYSLPEHIGSQPPLMSICILRGPVCEMDEMFLETAYKLLRIILETNALTGKHMLLCPSGEHILSLFEYPEAVIRIVFLDLLLCLAKNSKDVVKFLVNHHFDMTLLGKLERYGHIYTAGLCTCKGSMEKEIEKMVMILQVILEQTEDVRNWSEKRRASRVLWMFLCDKKCLWKPLMEECLSVLGGKSTQIHNHSWTFRQQHPTCKRAIHLMYRPFFNKLHISSNPTDKHLMELLLEIQTTLPRHGHQQTYRHGWANRHERHHGTNLFPNSKHNFDACHKSSSNGLHMDGFQANSKSGLEPTGDRLLMSRTGGDDKARFKYGGLSRQTTSRLAVLNTLKPPTSVPNCKVATCDMLSLCSDPSPVDGTEPVMKQMAKVNLDSATDYLIYGTKADVKPDKTHELVLQKKLWEIKEVLLAQKLCGLLNNNIEGSMFFGLSADSTIEGVRLERKDKDVFRNGIDRIMNRCLIPEVQAKSYDVVFTPVLRQDEKAVDLTQHSLYTVEIRVHPLVHTVYMVYQERKCFMRCGTETVECSVQQKKQDVMDAEVKALEESIKEMGRAALSDLASLAAFVNKYLPQQ